MATCNPIMCFILVLLYLRSVNSQLPMPLKEAAKGKGIFMGAAVSYPNLLNSDETFNKVAAEQYDLTTAGNACKWPNTEPKQNVYNFTQCDYVYNFAQHNNMTFRGHNLCWSNQNPSWLINGNFTPSELTNILQDHIINVVGHYKNEYENQQFICWDVVNEAVSDNPNQQLYKPNIWYPSIPNYVNLAFQSARNASNKVKLFYNDYNILMDSGWMSAKSNAVYNMTKNMKTNGIPIDGIGFQTHLSLSNYEYVMNGYNNIVSNFMRFAALGLEIHITEMDIDCGTYINGSMIPCNSWTPQMETQQAEMYKQVLKACLNVPECTNFETWGFTDKYAWRGTNEHPLPFDEYYNPKPAAFYIENELLNTTFKRTT